MGDFSTRPGAPPHPVKFGADFDFFARLFRVE
jgi:hypothetical protein